jgi:putative tricarboxylic transport membrane protein
MGTSSRVRRRDRGKRCADMKIKRENIIIGAVLLAFSIGYGYMITQLPTRNLPNTLGIDFMPWIFDIFLGVLSVLLVVGGIFGSIGPEVSRAKRLSGAEVRRTAILFAIFAAYIFLINAIGFLIATPFVVFAMMFLEGVRRYGRMILVSLIVTFAVYGLFRYVFEVRITGLAVPW